MLLHVSGLHFFLWLSEVRGVAMPQLVSTYPMSLGLFPQGVPPRSLQGLGFFDGPRVPGKAGQRAQWLSFAEAEEEGDRGAAASWGETGPAFPQFETQGSCSRLIAGAPEWAGGAGASPAPTNAEDPLPLPGLHRHRGPGTRQLRPGPPSEPVYLTST